MTDEQRDEGMDEDGDTVVSSLQDIATQIERIADMLSGFLDDYYEQEKYRR